MMRALHIIDSLDGGGSQRLLWDIIRKSDASLFKHRVVSIYPDMGNFVYGELLGQKNAYGRSHNGFVRKIAQMNMKSLSAFLNPLPAGCRRKLNALNRKRIHAIAFYRLLKEYLLFRPHVIHAHLCLGLSYGLFLKRWFRKPLVHTVPSLFSQMIDGGFGSLVQRYAQDHSLVDYFFTAYRDELLHIGVPPEKILTLDAMVDLETELAAKGRGGQHRTEIRRLLGISEDSLIALSVGRIHPSKGHQYALEALPYILKEVPNLHWIVLGQGEASELRSRSQELGVNDHVHLVGFKESTTPWYAAADIYLRTAVFEGENLSSCQAMAMGLPVIGFDTGCETDLIGKVGHGFLIPNRDAKALSFAVKQTLLLPDRGKAIGELGASYCRKYLDINRGLSTFFDAYTLLYRDEKEDKLNGGWTCDGDGPQVGRCK